MEKKQIISSLNKFKFFLAGNIDPIVENNPIWGESLPASRKNTLSFKSLFVTYGNYFKAAERFLSENCFQRVTSSVYQQSKMPISPENIDDISIFLEKHGEYYHPSKIEVTVEKQKWQFVLNSAFSEVGLKCAEKEFKLLRKLGHEYPSEFIPAVYEYGDVSDAILGSDFRMFLGQWFAGFNEFHIHSIGREGNCITEVWDQAQGNYFISEKQSFEIYRQTALIHTFFYNLETFEQIHPWHHAAGDFVVRNNGDHVQVRLVTVRGYYPLVHNDEKNIESMLEALLVFLLDLSIKNRIDRFRGVGDLVWTNDIFVMATIDGFFKGLYQKVMKDIIPQDLPKYFGLYLNSLSEFEIMDLFADILSKYPQQAPECPFIRSRLESHAFVFYQFVHKFLPSVLNEEFLKT